jgi:colanic acid biosynthesis glycosyl transferase WcaI
MNILFLADNFPPEKNAQASRVYERGCYWVKWGHRLTVITCAPNFPEGKVYTGYKNSWRSTEELSGIQVVRVKTFIAANAGTVLRILDFLSYMVTAFWAGLFQSRPDVVVATSPHLFAAVAGWALSRVKRVPFVMELSDLWPDSIVAVGAMRKSFALRWLEKLELFLYRRSAAVVALTPSFKANLVNRGIPAAKIAVVINGVELSRFKPQLKCVDLAREWSIEPDDFVLSYIGTLGMAHGLENLLDCAGLMDRPNVKFLLVGPGAERENLMAEAVRRGLSNVRFVPAQPKERMPDFWSISDVAVVHLKDTPLFKTVIPSKIFEAMGMGLPILLVAPEGEASKIVVNDNVGTWVPAGKPALLAEAVELLARNGELRARLAAASRAAAPRYSRERQAAEMISRVTAVVTGTVERAAAARAN